MNEIEVDSKENKLSNSSGYEVHSNVDKHSEAVSSFITFINEKKLFKFNLFSLAMKGLFNIIRFVTFLIIRKSAIYY